MATKASRGDVSIHNSLTTFFLSQDGEKSIKALYPELIDLVFKEHLVIWVEADVKSVIRAVKQRGGALEHEIALDEAKKKRYNEALQYIADNSQSRVSTNKAKKEMKKVIDEYKNIHEHSHSLLSRAQLALHRAMQSMAEKAREVREAKEEEEKEMRELVRKKRKADEVENKAKRIKAAQEKSAKRIEEAAERAKKEAQNTRAINNKLSKALKESNKDTYRKKRVEGEQRAELVRRVLSDYNKKDAAEAGKTGKEEKSVEEDEESDEEQENLMPE
jgi:predicted unusual protein kinase regulating ubiquinone biosynthesis (AarF/ABC1/UbiB family)